MSHLINAVRGPHNPRELLIVALSAYFDESFNEEDIGPPIMVVAGFLSPEKLWLNEFEPRWAKLLKKFDIPYFRMEEFAHFKGPFTGWEKREDARREFLGKAIKIIGKTTIGSFATGVLIKDWERCNQHYELEEQLFRPYPLCGWACMDNVYRWCRRQRRPYPRNQVMFFFEFGGPDQGDLIKVADRSFHVIPQTPRKIPQDGSPPLGALQAADFASWHVRNVLLKHNMGTLEQFRTDFDLLFSQFPNLAHVSFSMDISPPEPDMSKKVRITDDSNSGMPSLIRFCADYHIPPRKALLATGDDIKDESH
jgi:hypothetical protein